MTKKFGTASAPNLVAWAKITPHGWTIVDLLCVPYCPTYALSIQFHVWTLMDRFSCIINNANSARVLDSVHHDLLPIHEIKLEVFLKVLFLDTTCTREAVNGLRNLSMLNLLFVLRWPGACCWCFILIFWWIGNEQVFFSDIFGRLPLGSLLTSSTTGFTWPFIVDVPHKTDVGYLAKVDCIWRHHNRASLCWDHHQQWHDNYLI